MEKAGQVNPQSRMSRSARGLLGIHILIALMVTAPLSIGAVLAQTPTIGTSKVAPEFREAAEKRAAERRKLAECQKEVDTQKVLPRDRTKVLIACVDR